MRRLSALIAIVSCGIPSAALAQSYYLVNAKPGDEASFADRDSIRWRDGRPSLDFVVVRARPTRIQDSWIHGTGSRIEFDCDAPRFRMVGLSAYTISGNVAFSDSEVDEWQDLIENSVFDDVRDLACRNDVKGMEPLNFPRPTLFQYTIEVLAAD
ncbi:MAG: surface-adhesin E family protein [Brevundimonas sp.]